MEKIQRLIATGATITFLLTSATAIAATTTNPNDSTPMESTTTDQATTTDNEQTSDDETALDQNIFASEVDGAQQVLSLFMPRGAMGLISPGSTGLDITAVFSHSCYEIVGPIEEEDCARQFGRFAPFKDTIQSGLLSDLLLLNAFPLITEEMLSEMDLDAVSTDTDTDADAMTDDSGVLGENATGEDRDEDRDVAADETQNEHDRAAQVWQECGEIAGDQQAACFQDNLRLIEDLSIPVNDNLFFEAK